MDTSESFLEIINELAGHHSIFSMMWELGRPVMSDKVDTAAVAFNREGVCVEFIFNPDFLKKLDINDLCFIISHECLHVILGHGKRLKGLQSDLGNVAADITINEMLISQFGFTPSKWLMDMLCTRKTVFERRGIKAQANREFEYYYDLMMQNATVIKVIMAKEKGDGENGVTPIDDHSNMPDDIPQEIKEILEKISKEEVETLKKANEREAGNSPAYEWMKATLKPKPKDDWKKVIKNWTIKQYREKTKTQWKTLDRRFVDIQKRNPKLAIPSVGKLNMKFGHLIDMVFFMDVSGSCADESQKFFAAAKTIPRDKFIITPFAFNTGLIPVNIDDDKLPVGGGTSFHQLEEYCLAQSAYPSCVFCLTDGYGTGISPRYPDRWHVFLTVDEKHCFPKECNFYEFDDFHGNT